MVLLGIFNQSPFIICSVVIYSIFDVILDKKRELLFEKLSNLTMNTQSFVYMMNEVFLGAPSLRAFGKVNYIMEKYYNDVDETTKNSFVWNAASSWHTLRKELLTIFVTLPIILYPVNFQNYY